MWSFDYYPIRRNFKLKGDYPELNDDARKDLENIDTLTPQNEIYVTQEFFQWFEIFMDRAIKSGSPFWYVALGREYQSIQYKYKNSTRPYDVLRRYVSERYMRFAVFSALAYGAKGIGYWTFCTDVKIQGSSYFFGAPMVQDHDYPNNARPTGIWGQIRAVNREVQALSGLFLSSANHEVYHTGRCCYNNSNDDWAGTTPFPGFKGPVQGLTTSDMGVLISFFTSGANNYVMVVNHEIDTVQNIKIRLNTNYAVTKVAEAPAADEGRKAAALQDADGFPNPNDLNVTPSLYMPYTLRPGGYLILSYRRRIPATENT